MKRLSTISNRRLLGMLFGLGLATAAPVSMAASTWQFGGTNGCGVAAGSLSFSCAALVGSDPGAPAVQGSAFTSASGLFAPTTMQSWTGLGAGGESPAPDHAIDNKAGIELVALNFGTSSIALTTISMGYVSGDSDFSLFRWTGNSTPNPANVIVGKTADNNMNTGLASVNGSWELVGSFAGSGGGQPVNTVQSGQTLKSSSWWLVSAYASGYGGSCTAASGTVCSNGNDFFKLLTVAGTVGSPPPPPPGVPEPGTLALMGVAVAGMIGVRRRRTGQ